MKKLEGRTIRSIWINDDQQQLFFETDIGCIRYDTWADCCAECWFADILGFGALIGGTVISVEKLVIPEYLFGLTDEELRAFDPDNGRCRQQYDAVYGYGITTQIGRATIAFRCSSNGYYGGSVEFAGAHSPMPDCVQIMEDWSA